MIGLQITWFILVGVLLVGYAVLAGFDLGAGFWHLFTRDPRERRQIIKAVGPYWDSNQVWLLTGGGAIFAAFPPVYASVFSGFYLALMLVLAALIFRIVAIEFHGKVESEQWRRRWDWAFGLGSSLAALLFGVALGNILRGLPLSADGYYTGSFFGLLNPFSLLIGLTGLAMIALHGALFLAIKVEGALAERAVGWARRAWLVYLLLFVVATIWNFLAHPHNLANYRRYPPLLWAPFVVLGSLGAIPWMLRNGRRVGAFVISGAAIAGSMATVGMTIFPNLVQDPWTPAHSLSIYGASSSQLTLTVMLVLALIGVPTVLGYLTYVFRKFRGRVALESVDP